MNVEYAKTTSLARPCYTDLQKSLAQKILVLTLSESDYSSPLPMYASGKNNLFVLHIDYSSHSCMTASLRSPRSFLLVYAH